LPRDNYWLKVQLFRVWDEFFPDIPKLNTIHVSFGRSAKRRLASIRQLRYNDKSSDTRILVTGYYRDERVPETVITATLAHELCHYAHGFASPLPQFSRYPHKGDIVDREMIKRGLKDHLSFQEKWLRDHWNHVTGDKIFR